MTEFAWNRTIDKLPEDGKEVLALYKKCDGGYSRLLMRRSDAYRCWGSSHEDVSAYHAPEFWADIPDPIRGAPS